MFGFFLLFCPCSLPKSLPQFSQLLILLSATGYLEPILAVNGCGPGYILERSPVYHRASLSSSLILLSSLIQFSSRLPFMIQSASLPWSLMVNRSYCVLHVYHLSHNRYQSLDSWCPILNAQITIFYYYFNIIKTLHEYFFNFNGADLVQRVGTVV